MALMILFACSHGLLFELSAHDFQKQVGDATDFPGISFLELTAYSRQLKVNCVQQSELGSQKSGVSVLSTLAHQDPQIALAAYPDLSGLTKSARPDKSGLAKSARCLLLLPSY